MSTSHRPVSGSGFCHTNINERNSPKRTYWHSLCALLIACAHIEWRGASCGKSLPERVSSSRQVCTVYSLAPLSGRGSVLASTARRSRYPRAMAACLQRLATRPWPHPVSHERVAHLPVSHPDVREKYGRSQYTTFHTLSNSHLVYVGYQSQLMRSETRVAPRLPIQQRVRAVSARRRP